MTIKRISVPIFDNVEVYMSDEIMKDCPPWRACRELKFDHDPNDHEETSGYVLASTNGDIFMGINAGEPLKVIAHECVHAAWEILDFVGVKVNYKNHEMLAYLVDWLFENYIKKFKISID